MTLSTTTQILWTSAISIEFILLAILIWRRASNRFPMFVYYVGFCCGRSAVLYAVDASSGRDLYFYAYWCSVLGEPALLGCLVYELFAELLAPVRVLPRRALRWTFWIILGVAAVSVLLAFAFPGKFTHLLPTVARTFDRTIALVSCCAFWMIVFLSRRFGLPVQSRGFGIAFGFICYLTIEVIVTAVLAARPDRGTDVVVWTGMVAFICGELIWMCAFLAKEQPRAQIIPFQSRHKAIPPSLLR